VRNPLNKSQKESIVGIRNMESIHVKKNYKKYITAYMPHDPIHEINDIVVAGKKMDIVDPNQSMLLNSSMASYKTQQTIEEKPKSNASKRAETANEMAQLEMEKEKLEQQRYV